MNPGEPYPPELQEIERWLDEEAAASTPPAAAPETIERIAERARFEQALKDLSSFSLHHFARVAAQIIAGLLGGKIDRDSTDYRP